MDIHIIASTDVPMVFEVINDRGEQLKPYEVLKGELLGQLDKNDVEQTYLPKWSSAIDPLESLSDEEPDRFLRQFLRARYVTSESEYRQMDGEYHKVIFTAPWNAILGLKKNPAAVKQFIARHLSYYGRLYRRLLDRQVYEKPYGEHVYYNLLNELDRQYMLIMSACKPDDPDEEEKIRLVSQLLDRHFVLLQIFGCYDSNEFSETLLRLNAALRDKTVPEIKQAFDDQLTLDIAEAKGADHTTLMQGGIFQYSFFRDAGINLGIRFKRCFFARIENYIATGINPNHRLTANQYWDLVRNTGSVNGYHVEHILANNDENRQLFQNDEEVFQRERNRLGALLLLKGKDNIKSSNEPYQNKLATYNSADISNRWNRTLIDTFYHTNADFKAFAQREGLAFRPYSVYDATSIEERQKLLFDMVKRIWA